MRKNLISIIFILCFVLLISSSAFASQALPRHGINEQTKECSEFFMGDECMSCTMPEGWQMIEEFQCPGGYNKIQINSVCTPRKNSFCCTVQHSGASGDCEDVIVNDIEQKCAFVKDINKCEKLPTNWNQAEETESWRNLCPSLEYEWLEDTFDCETKIIGNDNINNQNNIIDDKQQKSNILLIVVIAAVIFILLTILWFFLIKQRQK